MARKYIFLLGILWTGFIFYACLLEGSSIPNPSFLKIPNKDKVAHFSFYFIFSVLWFIFFDKKYSSKQIKIKQGLAIFTVATFIGGVVEVFQYYFTNTRSAEWADFIANALGSATGLLIIITTTRQRKK